MTCCFTSFTYTYLPRARVLASSLRRAHPTWHLVAVVVDELPAGGSDQDLADSFDEVLRVEDLGIPNHRNWLFKHDVIEACTAVKGHALLALLDHHDKVVYLDPDIAVFYPLLELDDLLNSSSIVLTPHQVEPNQAPLVVADNEGASMQYGIYNLGFLAVRADASGYAFARWWARQLYRACYDEIDRGIFTDQKYCDLVPAMFDRVHIHRDPGWNVASWNISRRKLSIDTQGSIRVQGRPLCFYHFTKIGGTGDAMTHRYAVDNTVVLEIWNWYRRQLKHMAASWVPQGYWAHASFADGTAIPKSLRILFRHSRDLTAAFPDPFAKEGSFLSWVKSVNSSLLE